MKTGATKAKGTVKSGIKKKAQDGSEALLIDCLNDLCSAGYAESGLALIIAY